MVKAVAALQEGGPKITEEGADDASV